jgi:hypothetical protein
LKAKLIATLNKRLMNKRKKEVGFEISVRTYLWRATKQMKIVTNKAGTRVAVKIKIKPNNYNSYIIIKILTWFNQNH